VGGENVWVWECGWVLCVSHRPPGRRYSTTARSLEVFGASRWRSGKGSD
jgi:hypothetical protein